MLLLLIIISNLYIICCLADLIKELVFTVLAMGGREEVCQKYTSCVLKASRSERHACRDRFRTHDSVLKLLASSRLSDRLHPGIVQVMDELREEWQPEEVATAFDAMETYAVNLLEYPWKKEFHTILVNCFVFITRQHTDARY